jgi:hypothetical protein
VGDYSLKMPAITHPNPTLSHVGGGASGPS